MNTREKTSDLILYALVGAIPIIWIGLILAPYSNSVQLVISFTGSLSSLDSTSYNEQ